MTIEEKLNELCVCLESNARIFDELADQQDEWCKQSYSGGWSTHHCEGQTELANQMRRFAAQNRARLKKVRE